MGHSKAWSLAPWKDLGNWRLGNFKVNCWFRNFFNALVIWDITLRPLLFLKFPFVSLSFSYIKAKEKGQQRATAQFLYEAGWINRRNERALCLVHPFHKQLKIKPHVCLLFNSQSWNDRFPSGLVCLLVHRPQCLEVMLQTDFALKLMYISHSCFFTVKRWKISIWIEECLVFQVTLPCRGFLVSLSAGSRADYYYWRLLRQASVCGCAPACQNIRSGPCSAPIYLGLYYGSGWQGCDWDIWINEKRGRQHHATVDGILWCWRVLWTNNKFKQMLRVGERCSTLMLFSSMFSRSTYDLWHELST